MACGLHTWQEGGLPPQWPVVSSPSCPRWSPSRVGDITDNLQPLCVELPGPRQRPSLLRWLLHRPSLVSQDWSCRSRGHPTHVYVDEVGRKEGDFHCPPESTVTLFTPDTHQSNHHPQVNIRDALILLKKTLKILAVTWDTHLTIGLHARAINERANSTLRVLKALEVTGWCMAQKTLVSNYKAITRPILNYGAPIWTHIASPNSLDRLSVAQNSALRITSAQQTCTYVTRMGKPILAPYGKCNRDPYGPHMGCPYRNHIWAFPLNTHMGPIWASPYMDSIWAAHMGPIRIPVALPIWGLYGCPHRTHMGPIIEC